MSWSDAAGDAVNEVGIEELPALIGRLAPGEALTVAEVGTSEFTRWEIRADVCGTPSVVPYRVPWSNLRRDEGLDEQALLAFLAGDDEARLLVARSETGIDALDAGRALRVLRARHGGARPLAQGTAASLDDLFREATARVPLSQWYQLVLLDRASSGRLSFSWQQLFEPGNARGATCEFEVRCEPSGPAGTTFAVVASDGARATGLVSMASAKVPPGRYPLTATLLRPGTVRLAGLPGSLSPEPRTWPEIRASVPTRLGGYGPAHLILAVETCGSVNQVDAHLDRVRQLADDVALSAEGPVRFSLIGYGAHPHDPRFDDEPIERLAWAEDLEAVHDALPRLHEQAVNRRDRYTRAASIECMLAEVAHRLQTPQQPAGEGHPSGRPVLVTIGGRRPFPVVRDQVTEIVPCSARRDWRDLYRWLVTDHQEMTFGAICGGDQNAEVWRLLGRDAVADLVAFDARQFAADLRLLRPPTEHVPFPLVTR